MLVSMFVTVASPAVPVSVSSVESRKFNDAANLATGRRPSLKGANGLSEAYLLPLAAAELRTSFFFEESSSGLSAVRFVPGSPPSFGAIGGAVLQFENPLV